MLFCNDVESSFGNEQNMSAIKGSKSVCLVGIKTSNLAE